MDAELINNVNLVDASVIIKKLSEKITELTVQNAILAAQLENALSLSLKN